MKANPASTDRGARRDSHDPRAALRDDRTRLDEVLDLIEDQVTVGGMQLDLLRPLDPAALVSEDAFAENEFLPYWAEVWPSALRLADSLPEHLDGQRVVELGCGIGIPSLVAAARGAEVLATDWAEEALGLLARNAARNGLNVEVARVDWAAPTALIARAPFDLVIAADVLYEARNVAWLLALLPQLATHVLLADPGRDHARDFHRAIVGRYRAVELPGGVFSFEALV
ncbi:MAG TPA: methyltransferase domain-containing protein [Acidimicrobiales bacterium]|nr:methyltransferase domain-containing protein [Acidimicrobiales bacterium]